MCISFKYIQAWGEYMVGLAVCLLVDHAQSLGFDHQHFIVARVYKPQHLRRIRNSS